MRSTEKFIRQRLLGQSVDAAVSGLVAAALAKCDTAAVFFHRSDPPAVAMPVVTIGAVNFSYEELVFNDHIRDFLVERHLVCDFHRHSNSLMFRVSARKLTPYETSTLMNLMELCALVYLDPSIQVHSITSDAPQSVASH